jgi:hypothetical protein
MLTELPWKCQLSPTQKPKSEDAQVRYRLKEQFSFRSFLCKIPRSGSAAEVEEVRIYDMLHPIAGEEQSIYSFDLGTVVI